MADQDKSIDPPASGSTAPAPAPSPAAPPATPAPAPPAGAAKRPPRAKRSVHVPFEMPFKLSGKWSWAIMLLSLISFCALGYLLYTAMTLKRSNSPSPVELNKDSTENQARSFSIQLPVNWSTFGKTEIAGHYPVEPELISKCPPMGMRYSPQITVTQLRARAFDLKEHVKNFKEHIKEADASAEILATEDLFLDGVPAMRVEYTVNYKESEWPEATRLHIIAFLVEDGPEYFDLVGAAEEDDMPRYRDKLEASLRTFKRIQQKPEWKMEQE